MAIQAATDVYLKHDERTLAALFEPEYVEHDPNIVKRNAGPQTSALEAWLRTAKSPQGLNSFNPSIAVVNGEYVFMMWTVTSVDPDTPRKTYPWSYFQVVRVHNGRVAEHWDQERLGTSLLN